MTNREYRALRNSLEKARDSVGKSFNYVDKIMDCVPEEQWQDYHQLKGKLWYAYAELDNKIIKLDKEMSDN